MYESLDKNSTLLEDKIIKCIRENCPSNIFSKETFIEIINKWYKTDTKKYKDSLAFDKSGILYKLSKQSSDILDEDIEKDKDELYKKFNSIKLGSNFSYLDYTENCLSEIMKIIQDANMNSISYAKKSMQIRKDIESLIKSSYLITMKDYGDNLIQKSNQILGIRGTEKKL